METTINALQTNHLLMVSVFGLFPLALQCLAITTFCRQSWLSVWHLVIGFFLANCFGILLSTWFCGGMFFVIGSFSASLATVIPTVFWEFLGYVCWVMNPIPAVLLAAIELRLLNKRFGPGDNRILTICLLVFANLLLTVPSMRLFSNFVGGLGHL